MQKKLIAMAVAGMIAAPAFAQSNVTVYGIIDTFVGYAKAGDSKFTGVHNGVLNGPRIGFKGSEDLGNGLKAVFTLEQGFNSDDASPASTKEFHRQAWLGLEGGFGFIGLGRQYAPGFGAVATYSGAVAAGAIDASTPLTSGLSISAGSLARWDNSVKYKSKNFGGFSGEVIYSFTGTSGTESGADRGDDNDLGLGLNYANGPFAIGYVYQSTKAMDTAASSTVGIVGGVPAVVTTAAAEGTKQKEHYLGASYDFGAVKLMGSYQTADVDAATDNDIKVYYIGAVVPVGKGNIHVAYGARSEDADDMDSRSFAVAYTHNLSKRTIAYVGANRTTNDDSAARGVLATSAGDGSTAFGVGIRHAF